MTFVVNAMKQDKQTTNTYVFLVDVDSEQLGRDIFEATGMILLSIVKTSQKKTDFGPMYVKVLYEGTPYEIISPSSFTLKDLCLFFVYCGMEVVDVNSYFDMQTEEQVARIISYAKTTYTTEKENSRLKELKVKEKEEESKYFEDRLLERAKISITWVLDKIEVLLQTKKIHIPSEDQQWIDTQLNNIKKQRMGSNYEKIKVLMQDLFVFLYSLEDAHYASIQENGDSIFEGTVVSSYDLQRQVEILEEIKYHSSFGGMILGWRREYASVPFLSYLTFLKKDFLSLFDDLSLFIYRLYDFFLLLLSLVLVFLSSILIANHLFFLQMDLTSLYYSLVTLGWFTLLFYIAYLLRRKNAFRFMLGLFAIVLVVYYISLPIIEHSFALN